MLCCHTTEWNYQHYLSQTFEVWVHFTQEMIRSQQDCLNMGPPDVARTNFTPREILQHVALQDQDQAHL